MDDPDDPVDPTSIFLPSGILPGIKVPARPYFGYIGEAPRNADPLPSHLRGLLAPLIETPTRWMVQKFDFRNHLCDPQSEGFARSNLDLTLRNALRQTRKVLMNEFDLSEDEALSLMPVAVDFGVTQGADGIFGVHATTAKRTLGREP